MKTVFEGKKISGILGILPENVYYFDDEVNNYTFPVKQTMRLKKLMGFESHRMVKKDSFTSDLCIFGAEYLLKKGYIDKEEIGAIIVVTLSPDHFLPHISNTIQGELDFSEDVICLDIAQGCCGFLVGLMQSFLLLDKLGNKKVLLFNADVLSKKISPKDRNDFPLAGDGAAVTVIENDKTAEDIYYTIYMDGKRRNVLRIPAGGFRLPNSPETGELKDQGDGNFRALDHMHMDGADVFNFVQTEVPPCIDEILDFSGLKKDDIDYYLFHQPNTFMLQKLREKLEIDEEKIFSDLVRKYGNSSGASIPLVITDNLSKLMKKEKHICCLSAFGSGLAWGAMVINLGMMKFCDLVISDL